MQQNLFSSAAQQQAANGAAMDGAQNQHSGVVVHVFTQRPVWRTFQHHHVIVTDAITGSALMQTCLVMLAQGIQIGKGYWHSFAGEHDQCFIRILDNMG